MIAVVDYGAGNLFSVSNALTFLGVAHQLTSRAEDIEAADGIILPGVGAFPEAMNRLHAAGLVETLHKAAGEKPFWVSVWACRCVLIMAMSLRKRRAWG